ncbi:MAG: hypothetical protein CfP315_0786 [Candidatus Improbicoccus pseudotrichonymphae]|uniref:Uncharacterized protein n=1 Tax=Candidatus Improbicoccus pseudotrichonymphae TaxID=3033792 RepID=A0AA48KYT2_9FIRM|nr:MAG: hypothetical protein CfP315_0786 [Candidatus Improbicoccus pseudotrichonymphae]
MKKESNGIGENKNSKKISKNNKIISSVLAITMCCQSFVGAKLPLNTDGKVNVVVNVFKSVDDDMEVNSSFDIDKSENSLKGSKGENDNEDFSEKLEYIPKCEKREKLEKFKEKNSKIKQIFKQIWCFSKDMVRVAGAAAAGVYVSAILIVLFCVAIAPLVMIVQYIVS